jgi:hypothetical protein
VRGKDAAATIAAAVVFSCSIIFWGGVSPATGAQWLTNGSFDNGTDGWTLGGGISATGCSAGEAGIQFDDNAAIFAQNVSGPFPAGTYRFSGRARLLSGQGGTLLGSIRDLASTATEQDSIGELTTSFQSWSVDFQAAAEVQSFRVGVTLSSDATSVACLDDLSLEGPLGAPVPTQTSTPIPTATDTAIPSSSTPTATGTTAAPATATATVPAGSTPTAVAATATSAPSLAFTNGGFEDSTSGWRTNGGEIEAVESPRRSGSAAGRFSSDSTATSWLYQVIAIEPSQAYEFQGALWAEGGVAEAYLRVSWYGSGDGSGQLISSNDSTTRTGGGESSFVWLTTGPMNPPSGAHSARLRVMVAPAGGEAVVYLDDISLSTGPLVAATASATAAPPATQTARALEATQEAQSESGAGDDGSIPRPGATSQVAGARATGTVASTQEVLAAAKDQGATTTPRTNNRNAGGSSALNESEDLDALERPSDDAQIWPYFALPGVGLLVLAGLLYGKRRDAI